VSTDGSSFDKVFGYLSALKPGDPVVVKVFRGGRIVPLTGLARSL